MGRPVVSVASGGMAVVETPLGTPVTEAANGFGMPVTKVVGRPGMPVVYETIGVAVTPVVYATFNPADLSNVTLSNGNLTVTGKVGTGAARSGTSVSSGKYYFEGKLTAIINNSLTVGICTAAANLATVNGNSTAAAAATRLGSIFVNNVNTGATLGTRAVNDVIGVAVDATARLIWFRVAPSGNWNGSGTADPAAGTGGLNISALSGALFVLASTGSTANDVVTVNFGASAFSGAVPSGFTSGWPS
jgi:hypothetical protein